MVKGYGVWRKNQEGGWSLLTKFTYGDEAGRSAALLGSVKSANGWALIYPDTQVRVTELELGDEPCTSTTTYTASDGTTSPS